MGRILAVTNQKGGVGKTTTAINLAASLAASEIPTLLVDCDPQTNSAGGVGFRAQPGEPNLYHGMLGEADGESLLRPTGLELLSLIPGSRDMAGLNLELVNQPEREQRLRQLLEPLRERFALIVLDCPPALDLITLNALVAASGLIIPMQCEYFALEGVAHLVQTVEAVRNRWNPELAIAGVLLTLYDDRTTLSRQVADNLREHFGALVYRTVIPRNIRLAEAPSHGLPALLYDARSKGAEAYLELAQEVLERERSRQQTQSARTRA